jgi:hypothetical protein
MTAPIFCAGWKVFPLRPGTKKPIHEAWQNIATDDPAQHAAWVVEHPGCGWACAMGPSGLMAFDTDGGDIGEQSLFDFQLAKGFLPDTREHRSARGGRHIIYRDPDLTVRNSSSRLGPKLDTRGGNGYIVIPPSTFEGGTYELTHDRPIALVPAFVGPAVSRASERAVAAKVVSLDSTSSVSRATTLLRGYVAYGHIATQGNGGDERTFAVAAEVQNLGLSEDKAFEIINSIWNVACVPPWSEEELRVKIANAAAYSQNDTSAWAVPPVEDRISPEALDKLLADSASPQREGRRPSRFTPIFARDFAGLPQPIYTIQQLVPARAITLIYGASGSFKSFIVQDMLASTAAGIRALNKFATVQGAAIMSAGEAPYGIAHKRSPAWALARGIENLENFPFAIVPAVPLVSDAAEVKAFVAEMQAADIAPRIVAFDTVARAMGGLDENEARAAGLMIAAAEYVISELDCAVILVAHSGKDEAKGVRGSSALFAAVDAVFNVGRAKDTLAVTLACEKMKDADPPDDIHLQGQVVAGSLVFSAISADEHAALSRTNPPLAQADIQKALQVAGAVNGVEITTRQLAVSMLAGGDGNPKTLQAMEKRLRRGAEKQLAAYVVSGTGTGSGSALKWAFPTIANEGGEHV